MSVVLERFGDQLSRVRNTLFFALQAALRAIGSLRDNQNHVGRGPPPVLLDFRPALWALLSLVFQLVPRASIGQVSGSVSGVSLGL